jgi:prepilin-type processing-associated H-X9-DG protein
VVARLVGVGYPLAKSPTANFSTALSTNNYQMGSYHPGSSNFVMADGSVRAVSISTSEDTLRKLVVRNDGEVIPNDP